MKLDKNTVFAVQTLAHSTLSRRQHIPHRDSLCEAVGWTFPTHEGEYKVPHYKQGFSIGISALRLAMIDQGAIEQLYSLPTLYLCVLYLSDNKQRLVPLTA
jgi:hypothetical protein